MYSAAISYSDAKQNRCSITEDKSHWDRKACLPLHYVEVHKGGKVKLYYLYFIIISDRYYQYKTLR